MLILAHSDIVGYSGSTFQRMARLIGVVCPLLSKWQPCMNGYASRAGNSKSAPSGTHNTSLPAQAQEGKYMKNPNLTVKTVYGEIIVNKNDFIGNKIIQEGYWEIEDVKLVELIALELIKRKNGKKLYFYDIGANIGTYSLAIAKLTDDVEVISYEAQSQVFYMLCGTVALNRMRNIKCLNKAVSDIAEQTLEIRIPDYDSEGSFGSIELRKL